MCTQFILQILYVRRTYVYYIMFCKRIYRLVQILSLFHSYHHCECRCMDIDSLLEVHRRFLATLSGCVCVCCVCMVVAYKILNKFTFPSDHHRNWLTLLCALIVFDSLRKTKSFDWFVHIQWMRLNILGAVVRLIDNSIRERNSQYVPRILNI